MNKSKSLLSSQVISGLMGVCVGDALGVPVEFSSREERIKSPVVDLNSYNQWNELPGTWSDDSSLTFCLADSLCDGFSLQSIANSFCRWYYQGEWTARGKVFDIGITPKWRSKNYIKVHLHYKQEIQ